MDGVTLDKRFVDFIKDHHVMTIATVIDDEPWCASCFYSYLEELNAFVITSDPATKHASNFVSNKKIAGTIALETKIVGKIRGIQFQGEISTPMGELAAKAKTSYLKRFPFAIFLDSSLWIIEVSLIKMTDNRLGFGKKLFWKKDSTL